MADTLTWVDAFTATKFGGNPAGVCLVRTPWADGDMQALAAELGIAETAFVNPTQQADVYELRWFSPVTEIDLCGHATLASAHALRAQGVIDGSAPLTFCTRGGPLVASFEGDLITLDFPASPMADGPLPDALKHEWGESGVRGAGSTPFFAVVILATEGAVRNYIPNLAAISAVDHRAVVITAAADPGSGADYVLRVFGPKVGIDEDPATGSAQCVLGPYWSAVLHRPLPLAHQLSPRGAVLFVRPDGARVHISGNAVTLFTAFL